MLSPRHLDRKLSQLEKNFKSSEQLKNLDASGLHELGLFRSQLNKFKKEVHQAANTDTIDDIVQQYQYLFEINGEVKFKGEHFFLQRFSEFFILVGALGKMAEFTYESSMITSMLSWTSLALGLLTKSIVSMIDSVNLQIKKLEKIDAQIQRPLWQIIDPEKMPEFATTAYLYLQARLNFFKANANSINSIMLTYPTPTIILRLMLDCYHTIQNHDYPEIFEIKQMIDCCFVYLISMQGKLDAHQQALYEDFTASTRAAYSTGYY